MAKVRFVKKSVVNKDTLLSEVELKNRDDDKTRKLEKGLTKMAMKGKLLIAKPKDWERKIYKTKTFITDRSGEVVELDYQWKDFQSNQNILKNMTISFRWKPSIDDIKWLTNLFMDK